MRTMLLLPALVAGLLSLTACDFDDINVGHYTRDVHYNYPMSANGKLSVETFNGNIEVSGWDQEAVDISGTKQGPTQQAADELEVSVDHSANAISVRVLRPSVRRSNQGARFVIKVPRRAILDRLTSSNGAIRTTDGAGPARFRTSNGAIQVSSLAGSLEAQTSNGRITADLTSADGPVRLETSNGAIEVSLPAKFDEEVRAHTSNGGITLRAPSTLNARLAARTSNGKITSDLEMRTSGEISRTRIEGVIGAGGPLIDLTTSNGGIRITR
jgi:DUF4097 and DUF4098 domain-containing protein YvlB